jgi:hypothetical protein
MALLGIANHIHDIKNFSDFVLGLSLLCAHCSIVEVLLKPAYIKIRYSLDEMRFLSVRLSLAVWMAVNEISKYKDDMLFLSLLYSLASECPQLK